MRYVRLAVALAAGVSAVTAVTAACTSVVSGRGQAIRTQAVSRPPTTRTTAPTTATSSTTPSSSSYSPPPGLLRTPEQTAIGDPVTADLCAAVGLQAMRGLAPGVVPAFDPVQYPPGCSITESRDGTAVLSVGVFAHHGTPVAAKGRTTRTVNGQTVYVYPFNPSTGNCRRVVHGDAVTLTVDATPLGGAAAEQHLACGATDAMIDRLAAALTSGSVPRLSVASPSLSALDACKVAQQADVTTVPAFRGGDVIVRGYGASCEIRPSAVFLFFNFVISDAPRPGTGTPVTIDGHQLYQSAARADLCSYVSVQGTTADGHYEQLAAIATVRPSETAPPQLCEQTGTALAAYLTAAGLA